MKRKHVNRTIEFFLVGMGMGVVEDLIVVKLTTGATVSLRMLLIIALVALPFAIFSELIVDREDFHLFEKK